MAIRNNLIGGTDWVDGEVLYSVDLNDTIDRIAVIVTSSVSVGTAQLCYKHIVDDASFTNEEYLAADIFSDSDGLNDTVNTGSSTADYHYIDEQAGGIDYAGKYVLNIVDTSSGDTDHYGGSDSTWSDVSNAFDNDDATQSAHHDDRSGISDCYIGKTFSAKVVGVVRYKFTSSLGGSGGLLYCKLQKYNGSVWSDVTTIFDLDSDDSSYHYETGSYTVNESVQGLRLYFNYNDSQTEHRFTSVYSFEYGTYITDKTVVAESILPLTGDETYVSVFAKKTLPTDTSITVDITDGTTTISDQYLEQAIDISSLSSGNLGLTFNLATTDTLKTPELIGYGVSISKYNG